MSGVGPRERNTYRSGAPEHYVAGLGRGAIGFTTRSDIGPAKAENSTLDPTSFGAPPANYVAGGGRGMGGTVLETVNGMPGGGRGSGTAGLGGFGREMDANEDYGDYSETNYDAFSGYFARGGLFNDVPYDKEDEEADKVFAEIDDKMDSKRKRRRELKMLEDLKVARRSRPKITDQFADLKNDLKGISAAEWEGIPDIGDRGLKYKAHQQREDKYTPLPDHVIDGGRVANSTSHSVEEDGDKSSIVSGFAEARGTVLSLKLDKMSDSISGQTVVDPKGYLTDLNSLKITSSAEIGDIKKARLLLKSVTMTNPKHGPGWIAAARLEEVAGKLVVARKIIQQGCDSCPQNEDVWLENARLRNPQDAKTILAKALRHVKTSVKVWVQAANLESDLQAKKLVLRKALEYIPQSVKLWKSVIEMEDQNGAKVMLQRAVECVPHSVDMWLALARLETYSNAKKTLNKARAAIPTEPAIWITAAKLEEAHGNTTSIERIIAAAIKSLANRQVVIDRDMWIKEAELCEEAKSIVTCSAIIKNCIGIDVEDEDRKRTWMDDAENSMSRHANQTAKAIYAHALEAFPAKKSIWMRAAALEKKIGTPQSVEELLQKAVESCPQSEILWLMAAKEVWNNGNVDGARMILKQAFSGNPNSENIWLAAVKLEWENDEFDRARALLARARKQASSARVWMKSVLLEREVQNTEQEESLLIEGIKHYSSAEKLYLMAGQFYERTGKLDNARKYYRLGTQHCPACIPLWVHSATFEEKNASVTKARSILELGRLKNPKTDVLWLEAMRLEGRCENAKGRDNLLAKALQECPNSGILLAESIRVAPRAQQRGASLNALRKCDNDPHVCLAVARLFMAERKYAKARKWFERTVQLNPDLGDGWAYYYQFELSNGTQAQQQDIFTRCVAAEPKYGTSWCSQSKQTKNWRLKSDALLLLVVKQL